MNYFEFYGLEELFNIDESLVKRKFYELSKRYHPDFYINNSEEKQQEILELSTMNNKAYQVLADPAKRIEYVLDLHGLISEGEKYQLPESFLMEMMDVNEKLMELEFEEDPAVLNSIRKDVSDIENELSDELKKITSLYSDQSPADKQQALVKLKDLYYRQKYLSRIRGSLNKFHS